MGPISSTFFILPFIAFTISILVTTTTRAQLLPASTIIQDKLQASPSVEHLIHDLLKEYAEIDPTELLQVGTGSSQPEDQFRQVEDSSALKGIREAIRHRFDLYISQVKEVHGLETEEVEDGDILNHPRGVKRRQRRAVIKADTVLPGRRRRNITEHETGELSPRYQ